MNQRNVEALWAIVLEMAKKFNTSLDGLEYDPVTIQGLAKGEAS